MVRALVSAFLLSLLFLVPAPLQGQAPPATGPASSPTLDQLLESKLILWLERTGPASKVKWKETPRAISISWKDHFKVKKILKGKVPKKKKVKNTWGTFSARKATMDCHRRYSIHKKKKIKALWKSRKFLPQKGSQWILFIHQGYRAFWSVSKPVIEGIKGLLKGENERCSKCKSPRIVRKPLCKGRKLRGWKVICKKCNSTEKVLPQARKK